MTQTQRTLRPPGSNRPLMGGSPIFQVCKETAMFQPVLQVCMSALLVWRMYAKMDYYPATPWGCCKAVYGYMLELIKLRGNVLVERSGGSIVGTLMCSRVGLVRNPSDRIFPAQTRRLREEYKGRLAYFGKFAVDNIPDEAIRG